MSQPHMRSRRRWLCVIGASLALVALSCPPVSASCSAAGLSELKARLRKDLAAKRTSAAMSDIDALVRLDSKAAIEAICAYAFSADNYEVEKFTIGHLRELPANGEGVRAAARLANKHKDFKVRVALTLALESRKESEAFTAIVQNLFDRMDSVKRTAISVIERVDDLAAVPFLIQALELEEKRGQAGGLSAIEFRKCLTALTNHDFEIAADWRNFWKNNAEGFVRPPRPERDVQVTSVKRDPPVFFGMEVNSKRFVFVLDISGSMEKKDPSPEEEGDRGKGGQGGTGVGRERPKPKPKQEEIPDHRMRLRRVQKELIGVIRKLPRDVQFNIITFNHEVGQFKESLIPASDRNKLQAIEFVSAFQAEGQTHTDEALAKAFEYQQIDSIFLLSDGQPRRDNVKLPIKPILEWVRRENRFRRIRINTVGFMQAGKSLRKFMRSLASQNKGSYKELR